MKRLILSTLAALAVASLALAQTGVRPGTGALNSGKAEDAAHASGDVGFETLCVRSDSAASTAGTDGDYAALTCDASGRLWVNTTGGTVTPAAGAPAASYIEDAAETAGAALNMAGSVRRDTPASSAGTTGDNATLNTDALGGLYVQETGAAAITCGNTDVPAAGTAVNLGANACKEVIVGCPAANTSPCYIRGSAGNGITGGMVIPKGTGGVKLRVNNSNLLWVDAGTNGDDVTWCCLN